jgi:hypothetical protein
MSNVKFFEDNKYCTVESAVDITLATVASQYTLFVQRLKKDSSFNTQVPGSFTETYDLLTESLLLNLKPIIESNTGLELIPTYSCYRVYNQGQELKPHTDREECEISATLCLGYNYDDKDGSWPLVVNGVEFFMKPSDMVIYRGIELEHSRTPFNKGTNAYHSQVFLHYVDKNGPYSNLAFDGRSDIGLPN